jgi:hypothetical protein
MVAAHPALLTGAEAARRVGLDPVALSRWTRRGRLTPAARTPGGHCRWDLDDLRMQLRKLDLLPEHGGAHSPTGVSRRPAADPAGPVGASD